MHCRLQNAEDARNLGQSLKKVVGNVEFAQNRKSYDFKASDTAVWEY